MINGEEEEDDDENKKTSNESCKCLKQLKS